MARGEMRVLLVDADPASAAAVREAMLGRGTVRVAERLGDGLRALGEGPWSLVLLSLELPGSALELAARVVEEGRGAGVVLSAARLSPELAMAAVRAGALDLLEHPLDAPAVAGVLARMGAAGERVPLPGLPAAGEGEGEGGVLVGSSPGLMEAYKTVGRVAASPATVLVTGESGTGKELVARALHRLSGRSRGPFVAVNCAAIPEDLLESELFGHEKGAFTGAIARKVGRFERASGGTLFLDEIGDMSLVLQAKILRALQEREIERLGGEERVRVDVRIAAATHRDLAALIEAGEFREDLYYRLAVVRVHLAPLRERGRDVRELALHYAARLAAEYGRPLRYVSVAALERLEAHDWPGNVRELRNVVERAVLAAEGDTLSAAGLDFDRPRGARPVGEALAGYGPALSMAQVERLHIARVLEEVGGNVSRAAEILGMHRNTVSRKAQEHGVSVRR